MDFNLLVLKQKSPKLKIFKSQNLNIFEIGEFGFMSCHGAKKNKIPKTHRTGS